MSEVRKLHTLISASAQITLTEQEIRAIDALCGYGIDSFLKAFYASLGRAYLQPYEAGLRSFFASVSGIVSICKDAEECREFMAQSQLELERKMRGVDRCIPGGGA